MLSSAAHVINVGESVPYNRHVLFGRNSFIVIIVDTMAVALALLTVLCRAVGFERFCDTTVERSMVFKRTLSSTELLRAWYSARLSSVLFREGYYYIDGFHASLPKRRDIVFSSAIPLELDSTRGCHLLEDLTKSPAKMTHIPPTICLGVLLRNVMHDQLADKLLTQ